MAKRRADGGFVPKNQDSTDPGLAGAKHHDWGTGYAAGGSVSRGTPAPTKLAGDKYHNWGEGYRDGGLVGGSGSGKGRLRNSRAAAKIPAKTEL